MHRSKCVWTLALKLPSSLRSSLFSRSASSGHPATRRQAASDGGHLPDTGPVRGAGYQVPGGRAADGSPGGVQWALHQLHPLPQSTAARRGQVHRLNGRNTHSPHLPYISIWFNSKKRSCFENTLFIFNSCSEWDDAEYFDLRRGSLWIPNDVHSLNTVSLLFLFVKLVNDTSVYCLEFCT